MRKMMKKFIATFLVVAIILCSAPLSGLVGLELPKWFDFSIKSSATTTGDCGEDLIWKYDDTTDTLTVSGTGEMYDYEYAMRSWEWDANSSDQPWEKYRTTTKSIVIDNGVTTVGNYAFASFTNLMTVTIGDAVESINEGAFYFCDNLVNVSLNGNIKSIGSFAFYSCMCLESISLPNSIEKIGEQAFYECLSLNNISIPENIKSIEYFTFACAGITSITIPNKVEIIDEGAFDWCVSLKILTLSNSVTEIKDSAFAYCDILSDVYFLGTEEEWNSIKIGEYNEALQYATIHFITENPDYEIKLYSKVPTMVIGEGNSVSCAVQLEYRNVAVEENGMYSFASSNSAVLTISNIHSEADTTYFDIHGVNEGYAIVTIIENNTGTIRSIKVCVNKNILTYNAEAMPSYYDKNYEFNGYIGGMYIDEFQSIQKDDSNMTVSFNVYNSVNLVGSVDVFDNCGNLKKSKRIERHDDVSVNSIAGTIMTGYNLIEDAISGEIFTYKQDVISTVTEIVVDVPIGGHIEITNDPTYSESCAIYNGTELVVTSILLFGKIFDTYNSKQEEVTKEISQNIVDEFIKALKEKAFDNFDKKKIHSLGVNFIGKFIEVSMVEVVESSISQTLAELVEDCKAILQECEIDLHKMLVSALANALVNVPMETLQDAMGPFDKMLDGMFYFADYTEYTCFYITLTKPHSKKAMCIYFNNAEGYLTDNGVSIMAYNGTSLSLDNFVMHSIVLSNENDLTNEMRSSLNKISSNYLVRNIYLERDGLISQPGQDVQVSIPVPEGYDINKCVIYWVRDDGTLQKINTEIEGQSLVFITNHFSHYAVVEDENMCRITIQNPSRTTIRYKDGIILHANIGGTLPQNTSIVWQIDNDNFKAKHTGESSLEIISNKNGYSQISVIVFDSEYNIVAIDSVEMRSKAGFGDKIGGFFRSLFGATKIYEN